VKKKEKIAKELEEREEQLEKIRLDKEAK